MGGFLVLFILTDSRLQAKRALAISLAKEFGPQGVHVAWANIDGPIDIPGRQDYRVNLATEAKIDPDDIAEAYFSLHMQVCLRHER